MATPNNELTDARDNVVKQLAQIGKTVNAYDPRGSTSTAEATARFAHSLIAIAEFLERELTPKPGVDISK